MKEISVQIVTWKRKSMLVDLIESLEKQTVSNDIYEICICDSFSNDGTAEAVALLIKQYQNIKYYNISTNTLSAKRNFLFSTTEAPIIISLDDDLIVNNNFIKAHYQAQKEEKNSIICGQIRFPFEWTERSNYYKYRDSNHISTDKLKTSFVELLPRNIVAMNMSFKRSDIEPIGYMDLDFVNYGGEDIEFGYRVKKNNLKILYCQDALAFHFENSKLEGYLNKLYISACYSSRLVLEKAPDVLEESKSLLLTPIKVDDNFIIKLKKELLNIFLNKWLNIFLVFYLKKIDNIRLLYSHTLYQYICAYALKKGTRDQDLSDRHANWL